MDPTQCTHALNHQQNKSPAEKLGLKIRIARIMASYTQEKLAVRSGLSMAYIGMIERGEKNITILNCHKLAKALDITIGDLLDGVFDSEKTYCKHECRNC
ncbi:helix-turn-helix domain-containing protein [Pelodictyon luteolum]|nr:helix-turn-helix transcriptional regulator [Pelodictyon luteolum]